MATEKKKCIWKNKWNKVTEKKIIIREADAGNFGFLMWVFPARQSPGWRVTGSAFHRLAEVCWAAHTLWSVLKGRGFQLLYWGQTTKGHIFRATKYTGSTQKVERSENKTSRKTKPNKQNTESLISPAMPFRHPEKALNPRAVVVARWQVKTPALPCSCFENTGLSTRTNAQPWIPIGLVHLAP